MHFLKCNNCGHLNEVKTEYLTFCNNFQKKIEFINVGYMKNRTLFQVTVIYRSDDPNGKAVGERVTGSIRFEKKENKS